MSVAAELYVVEPLLTVIAATGQKILSIWRAGLEPLLTGVTNTALDTLLLSE